MCDLVDLDVLRPCHTGGLTSNFAPGVGKLTVFNTWLVLSSPLCPGGGGGGRCYKWLRHYWLVFAFLKSRISLETLCKGLLF